MKWQKWWLVAASPLLFGFGPTFESDLERSLQGKVLSGTAFHRTVLTVMKRHGRVVGYQNTGPKYLQHTIGDGRARLLWVQDGALRGDLILIWKEGEMARVQELAKPTDDVYQMYRPGYLTGDELIFADAAHDGSNVLQPRLRVYKRRGSTWKLTQNLSAGAREAQTVLDFERHNGKINVSRVNGFVRVDPKYLSQAHVGPMLTYAVRFERIRGVYKQTQNERIETPLARLEDLAGFRAKGNRAEFNKRVPRSVRDRLWKALAPSDYLTVSSNSNLSEDSERDFLVPGWEIAFRKSGQRWVVRSIRPNPDGF